MEAKNIFTALLAIQDKYAAYFKANHKTVSNYIEITWQKPLRVRIVDCDMPKRLRYDIERTVLKVVEQ